MRKKFIHFLWGLLFVTVLLTGLAFFAISEGWIGYVPELKQLDRQICVSSAHIRRAIARNLCTLRKPRIRFIRQNIALCNKSFGCHRRHKVLRPLGHRLPLAYACRCETRNTRKRKRGRRLNDNTATCQAALFFHGKELHEAYDSKACGMGHSREIGTLLH